MFVARFQQIFLINRFIEENLHTIKVTHFMYTLSFLFCQFTELCEIIKISFRVFLLPCKDPSYPFSVNLLSSISLSIYLSTYLGINISIFL